MFLVRLDGLTRSAYIRKMKSQKIMTNTFVTRVTYAYMWILYTETQKQEAFTQTHTHTDTQTHTNN